MRTGKDREGLAELGRELEDFIRSLAHPIVVEDEEELFDLSAAEWRISIQFGKMIFEAWNASRSIRRRIEELAYRDAARIGVFSQSSRTGLTTTLEFCEQAPALADRRRRRSRDEFSRQLVAMLARNYPGWKLEWVSHHSDREFSLSTWYTRGLLRRGQTAWAVMGLNEGETLAATDSMLAFGLIWLEWVRNHAKHVIVPGLRLFMPKEAVERNRLRARWLQAAKLELFEWRPGEANPRQVNIDNGTEPEVRLVGRRKGQLLLNRHHEWLREILEDLFDRICLVPESNGNALSIRVAGLEIARVEGDLSPRLLYGLEGHVSEYHPRDRAKLLAFIRASLERRAARNTNHEDEFYRLQGERWLESILVDDITKVDPELSPQFVYSQVPSFASNDRGVIDILGVSRQGRLAVVELKLEMGINLPFQALDYWMRVAHLAKLGTLQEFGYFPGIALQTAAPRLYLVAPAFRFHSTLESVLRYFDPSVEVIRVGINENWRDEVRVLFRHARFDGGERGAGS